jgi:GNAT superfamily N-acetyltransferase
VETTGKVRIRPLGQPGDLGWVVMAHGEVYAEEFGWDPTFEALVSRIVADYGGSAGAVDRGAWIATVDGRRVGSVFCVPDEQEGTARLRVLLVHPDGRGLGLGGRLVDTALAFAREAGYRRMRLWTTHPLVAARHLYLTRGFTLTEEERCRRRFGADLIGQTYELDLVAP